MGIFRKQSCRGFTLLEVAVTISIMALILTGGVSLLTQPLEFDREQETIDNLKALKRAILGDRDAVSQEIRTDFGFIGTMGSVPVAMSDLWLMGTQPAFTLDTSLKLGTGWAGPYIEVPPLTEADALGLDGWGNAIVLDTVAGVSLSTGQNYTARLISPGSDAALGTNDDLTVELYQTDAIATIAGYVYDSVGNPLSGVPITLRHPVSGIPGLTTGETDQAGAFQISGISIGNRSLDVQPRLLYQPGTAVTFGGNSQHVEFFVQNFSTNTVTFDRMTMEWSAPVAFYSRVRFGGTQVYNDNSNRIASGQTITFANQNVAGSGSTALTTQPVRIQSAFTQVPDTRFGAGQGGGTVRVRINNFRTLQFGGGATVNMSGVTFRVTFSDGVNSSVAIFTTDL